MNETTPEGLPLAHYAAVKAAVAEGFTLEKVLSEEGLSPEHFTLADAAWKAELAADPALLRSYADTLAQAEDRLDRAVEPLSADATAWASFLAAFEAHENPLDLLATLGLGLNDLSRLARHWSRRLETDPALTGRLAELRKKKPAAIPAIKARPPILRPSPMAKVPAEDAPDQSTAAPPSLPDIVPLGMRRFTNLTSTEASPEPPTGPALPFVPPPAAAPPEAARVAPLVPEGMRRFTSLTGTTPAPELAPKRAIPFGPVHEPEPAPVVPAGMRHFTSLETTTTAPEAPAGPALPFVPPPPGGAAASLPETTGAAPPVPEGMRHFTSLTGTTLAPDVPRGPAMPFPAGPDPKAPTPAAAPGLALEQYTCMCVELALYPAHSAAILARYGIRDDERRQLDGYWGAKVRQDAEARALWDRVYAEHWTRLGGPRTR